ncbi:MAG TPA: Bax inhibitor-1/YccA family protein, partial [Opitutaceae bacterium]
MFEANPSIKRISGEGVVTTPLTYNGVIHRTGILVLITSVVFSFVWQGLQTGSVPPIAGMVGSILGLILALVIIFTKTSNPLLI